MRFMAFLMLCASCGADYGGSGSSTGPDAASGAAAQCTSNSFWSGGENGAMRPGEACIGCHASSIEAPKLTIAGTVYATAHEPDDCNGASGATVQITDASGATLTLTTNAAGSFYSSAAISFPVHAAVVTSSGTRAMAAAQVTGDCNTCHTQAGASGAPGRVVTP